MPKLHFIVEGQTEERFVNQVLKSHLTTFNISCSSSLVRTSRKSSGSVGSYELAKNEINRWIYRLNKADYYITTMFDLYGLPGSFPAYNEAKQKGNKRDQVATLEQAMAEGINNPRFIPYIQLHEFEALLFAEPRKLGIQFSAPKNVFEQLEKILSKCKSPEEIDDGPETAPSKRIIEHIPEYKGRKTTAGPLVAAKIGLPKLREKCQHFNDWLTKLENLINPSQ